MLTIWLRQAICADPLNRSMNGSGLFLWRKGIPSIWRTFWKTLAYLHVNRVRRRQKKGDTKMTSSMIRTLVTLGLSAVLSPVALLAQGPVIATIPFDFTVGAKTLAAGTYQVKQVNQAAIQLQYSDFACATSAPVARVVITLSTGSLATPMALPGYGTSGCLPPGVQVTPFRAAEITL